ncbi:hypothetical protein FIV00_17175 [Labrenzia sp. THAF82]|uniref:iron chaperone n=1 Tax=Labrenzia sp. THAF82 TaxID=2587861 RepID=UPI00126805D9|nr:DUF1801 domain-containing protein [Labrenzia sp. THAF82]QFT32226.1 hypothetical protein FIV00_17175 [Labrenzia sp. THAF82]
MLYDANTPKDYLDQLDPDWRRDKLLEIRELILSEGKNLEESIHYKMLGYGKDEDYLFHLNAQRGYVSLYVGNASKVDPDGELLSGLSVGKGCIRFTKTKSIEKTGTKDFVAKAYQMWETGEDTSC